MKIFNILSLLLVLFVSACAVKKNNKVDPEHDHNSHSHNSNIDHDAGVMAARVASDTLDQQGITELFTNYFYLKNALAKGDKQQILNFSGGLYRTVSAISADNLSEKSRAIFLSKKSLLENAASEIANEKDMAAQRNTFMKLSTDMFEVTKVADAAYPIYYFYCENLNGGKGAYWLSKSQAVSNPYDNSQCGIVQQTIE